MDCEKCSLPFSQTCLCDFEEMHERMIALEERIQMLENSEVQEFTFNKQEPDSKPYGIDLDGNKVFKCRNCDGLIIRANIGDLFDFPFCHECAFDRNHENKKLNDLRVLCNQLEGQFFVFPENNDVPWGMDFSCYSKNIPSGIWFKMERMKTACYEHFSGKVRLVAPGYGGDPYGSGHICVELKDILPFQASRENS